MNDEHLQPPSLFGPLAQGQNWIMPNESLAIKHVGKYLVECTITKTPAKALSKRRNRGFAQLLSINEVQSFLQVRKAVLAQAE